MKRLGKKFQFLSFELFFFLLRNKIQTENNTKEDFFLLVNINLQSKRSVRWIVSLPRQFTSSLFKTLQLTFELKSRRTESNVCALNCKWNIFFFHIFSSLFVVPWSFSFKLRPFWATLSCNFDSEVRRTTNPSSSHFFLKDCEANYNFKLWFDASFARWLKLAAIASL